MEHFFIPPLKYLNEDDDVIGGRSPIGLRLTLSGCQTVDVDKKVSVPKQLMYEGSHIRIEYTVHLSLKENKLI